MITSTFGQAARADSSREFIMSATYGTLAGTLVGVASLAFTSQPGDNLKSIARGASLGLYAGILLGLYVVYVVPNQGAEKENNDSDPAPATETKDGAFHKIPALVPLISKEGIEGLAVEWQPYTF